MKKNSNIKYFAYILRGDSGFAPNPFFDFCTLATCKPKIRKKAETGDWVIGLGSKNQNCRGRLIYAMQVTKKMTYNEYWKNKDFSEKKYSNKNSRTKYGDNIYYKNSKGNWIQAKNQFHNGEEIKRHDTQTNAVLILSKFFYFGKKHIELPNYFKKSVSKLTQGHKYKGLEKEGEKLIKFLYRKYINNQSHGEPIGYKNDKKRCVPKKLQKKYTQIKGCKSSLRLCG